MDGKLTWIDDHQQLAIKTSQGWREIQVELISRSLELYYILFQRLTPL